MFSLMPFGFLFIFITFFGTILSLSSLHWLGIWAGLEINLMGFIPILVYSGMLQETESGMKYFVIQALGSGMIMAGSLFSFSLFLTWESCSIISFTGVVILIFGLMLKLGSFPFHFWLPSVMAGISWLSCLVLTTWQKLAPLFLLMTLITVYASSSSYMLLFLLLAAGGSSLVGGFGGVNQTQIRALLAYSSISHMGWMLLCCLTSLSALKIYFATYFIISISVFLALWYSEKSLFAQTGSSSSNSKINELVLLFMLLSLGGMPPLLGFFSKWIAIWTSCSSVSLLSLAPLLSGSLISLFYYLSLMFSMSLFSGTHNLTPLLPCPSNPITVMAPTKKYSQPLSFTLLMIMVINLLGGLFIYGTLPIFDFL
uniref:NADH-ubiquinone oxidoreductase chain 2 n=1 Tax=Umbonium thomasi TaxID=307063 RepID=A0A481U9L8_9VEST|nr:NADH dehydrogenase subunit 2 [Umbonium thomasi]QBI37693.1 NADH dehydrogenase subunit 2 [Umbonium thomasi]